MASADDLAAWTSVPWTPVDETAIPNPGLTSTSASPSPAAAEPSAINGTGIPIGWHKSRVPYLPLGQALSLQTLDVWIPNTNHVSSTPDSTTFPALPGIWIIYIHGGAWRDPAIDSTSFAQAATLLLRRAASSVSSTSPAIAGLASLNYRLSPHPQHPAPSDPARQATHPDHISDVLTALSFLHRLQSSSGQNNTKWILTGHSCGATLAFQSVASPSRWGLPSAQLQFPKPAAVVGFNGLYDLAGFISSPPTDYAWLKEGYREFVTGAFGADEKVWRVVCPAWDSKEEDGGTEGELFVKGWVDEWIGSSGRGKVMLVNSWEDSLVPWQQAEVMRKCWGLQEGVAISVVEGEGDHDDAWKDGKKMAEVLWHVASSSL